MVSSLQEPIFAAISLIGIVLLVGFLNLRSVLADRSLEITTSVALIITAVLGILAGGHRFHQLRVAAPVQVARPVPECPAGRTRE
jgi:uncharacterized membrane protein (DUF4010 family)